MRGTFAISKSLRTEKLTNGALVTPSPGDRRCNMLIQWLKLTLQIDDCIYIFHCSQKVISMYKLLDNRYDLQYVYVLWQSIFHAHHILARVHYKAEFSVSLYMFAYNCGGKPNKPSWLYHVVYMFTMFMYLYEMKCFGVSLNIKKIEIVTKTWFRKKALIYLVLKCIILLHSDG